MLLNKSFNLGLPYREKKGSQRGHEYIHMISNIWMKPEKFIHLLYIWKTSVYLHNLFSFHSDAYHVDTISSPCDSLLWVNTDAVSPQIF